MGAHLTLEGVYSGGDIRVIGSQSYNTEEELRLPGSRLISRVPASMSITDRAVTENRLLGRRRNSELPTPAHSYVLSLRRKPDSLEAGDW